MGSGLGHASPWRAPIWLAGDRERTVQEAQAVYDLAVSKQHPWMTGELAFWRWRLSLSVRAGHGTHVSIDSTD